MKTTRSLRFRLLAASAVWLLVSLVAGFFVLSSIFRAHVTEGFYEELTVHAEELERLNKMRDAPQGTLRSRFSDPRYDIAKSGYYWEVRLADGNVLGSASLEGGRIGNPSTPAQQVRDDHHLTIDGPTGQLLAIAHPSSEGNTYVIGTDRRHLESAVAGFDRTLAASLAAFGGVILISIIGFVATSLAPFRVLARAMRRVRSGESASVEGRYPDEVEPLVSELNGMISAQRESLERARAQAGNLAHGLKGPLAIVTNEAFQLEERGETSAGLVISEQCRAMQIHIDHHIARARAQAMARSPGIRARVAEVLLPVVNALTRLHARPGVRLDVNLEDGLAAAVDSQDLNEMLANLIDNAFKFASSEIALHGMAQETEILLAVEDDGPGLDPEMYDLVFAPGARLDETKPGSGLGLAIVRDLVTLYRGKVHLARSELGGLRVELTLPAAERPQ